jgi:serine/threonine-protein kinase
VSEGELIQIDDYQIVNTIFQGNSTKVLEVSDGGMTYAMKILLPESFKDSVQKQALKREAKVAKALDHPNLVQFEKLVFTKEHGYMLMGFFRGVNLKVQISNDLVGLQGRIRKLIDGMCLALGYMHDKGWVHKDVKPDNVMFNKSSELKLVDYSLSTRAANVLSKILHTKINKEIKGTRTYIAPETLKKEPETPQTDMYSLGVTLFEVLTGDLPFKGTTPAELLKKHAIETPPDPSSMNSNVTPEMDRFVLRLLSKSPKNRHKSMDEVHAEFRSLQPFKEDVREIAQRVEEEAHQKEMESLNAAIKLDSRSDAMKSSLLESGQLKDDPASKPVPKALRPVARVEPQQPVPPMPQQPQIPPQPSMSPNAPVAYQQPPMQQPMPQQPGVPPQPYPVQQMPVQPMPGQPMSGQPMPGQPMPGQPMPGQPMPGQPMPGQPMPGQPMPPQQMPPQAQPPNAPPVSPQQPIPQQQQPAAPATPPNTQPGPPASSPQPAQPVEASNDENKPDDDMPFMDELPDVL